MKKANALKTRLKAVQLLLCDVDGVLTNGTVFVGQGGEFKQFDIQDGLGIGVLRKQGIRVGWISSRPSAATALRAGELRIDFVHQERGSKLAAAEAILSKAAVTWSEVCYMGDDLVDLCLLKRAGVAIAVANAVPEVKAAADYVTRLAGGQGAVREMIEMILKAQRKWTRVLQQYSE